MQKAKSRLWVINIRAEVPTKLNDTHEFQGTYTEAMQRAYTLARNTSYMGPKGPNRKVYTMVQGMSSDPNRGLVKVHESWSQLKDGAKPL